MHFCQINRACKAKRTGAEMDEHKQQISQARWIAVLAATAIALYLCWLMLKPFIGVLEWAAVLVIVFYPVHKRLAKRIRRRGLSALISSLLVVLIVVPPLTFLTMALANELAVAARSLPSHVNQLTGHQLLEEFLSGYKITLL